LRGFYSCAKGKPEKSGDAVQKICRRLFGLTQIAGIDPVLARFDLGIFHLTLQLLFLRFELLHLIFEGHHIVALVHIDAAGRAGIFGLEIFELVDAFVYGIDCA
jgi:hypothetical protein